MHLYLNRQGAAPEEWLVSVLCEHFGYKPREALWELYGIEWEQAPAGLHWTILQMRAYAEAKTAVEAHRKNNKVPLEHTAMVDRVYEIEQMIGEEKRRAAQGGEGCPPPDGQAEGVSQ